MIRTIAKKTGKPEVCPLPNKLMPCLKKYLKSVKGQILLDDKKIRNTWDAIRKKAGFFKVEKLDDGTKKIVWTVTRQDLRRTNKTLLQKVGSIDSVRNLLGHSDHRVTEKFYTDTELIERWKVNQLPVDKWLGK